LFLSIFRPPASGISSNGGTMLSQSRSIRLNSSRDIFILLGFLVLLIGAAAQTQKRKTPADLPKYDLQTEAKFKGTVEGLKEPPKGSEKEITHLLVKNGTDTFDIYLCPKSFLDDMGMSFSKGDELAFTGSKVKQDGADLILAREVVKGDNTLVLRDEKGGPVWGWRH
jgi:hypothetical protein